MLLTTWEYGIVPTDMPLPLCLKILMKGRQISIKSKNISAKSSREWNFFNTFMNVFSNWNDHINCRQPITATHIIQSFSLHCHRNHFIISFSFYTIKVKKWYVYMWWKWQGDSNGQITIIVPVPVFFEIMRREIWFNTRQFVLQDIVSMYYFFNKVIINRFWVTF